MKLFKVFLMLSISIFFIVSCGVGEEDEGDASSGIGQSCESTLDCRVGLTCDTEKNICTDGSNGSSSESGDHGDNSDNGNNQDGGSTDEENGEGNGNNDGESSEDNSGNNDGDFVENCSLPCNPGTRCHCTYQGDPVTENVGPCKSGVATCKEDGSWGKCEGEVLPQNEFGEGLCADGIDNDCNGVVDDGTDFDEDGVGACTDCCETTEQCPFPKEAWDNSIATHLCEYAEDMLYSCDSDITNPSSTDPKDYAKAIGICKTTTEDSNEWGLISATISAPNFDPNNPTSVDKGVHTGSNGLASAFGNVIVPKAGSYMLALTSGKIQNNKFTPYNPGALGITSDAPQDWYAKNGYAFPSAASCQSSGTSGTVNDAVMLQMRIRVPKTAKSFSFNIYFFTQEYPDWICSSFNDFFIALLDSNYTSSDPTLQNPADKNLAMDSLGNPVGINLAPAGLFTQCVNQPADGVTSCIGTEELKGTGFESNGGTGWLTTRGNVVGGEIITLRLAIWDLEDHYLDSLVLIDNFKWDVAEYTPGTGQY